MHSLTPCNPLGDPVPAILRGTAHKLVPRLKFRDVSRSETSNQSSSATKRSVQSPIRSTSCCKSTGFIGAILHRKRVRKTYTHPTWAASAGGSTHEKLTSNPLHLQRFARVAACFSLVCHRAATVQSTAHLLLAASSRGREAQYTESRKTGQSMAGRRSRRRGQASSPDAVAERSAAAVSSILR